MRKLNFQRMTTEVTHLWTCDKTIFRIGIPTQRKYTNKKKSILSKILQISLQQQTQNLNYSNSAQKRTKQNLDRIVIVRVGTYI